MSEPVRNFNQSIHVKGAKETHYPAPGTLMLSFSGVRTPAFRPVVKRLYLCHAGRFWFSMYRLNVSSGAPPAVPA